MPYRTSRARSALPSGPTARPVFVESLPDWEFPPSFAAFTAARRRALTSLASPPPVPPSPAPPDEDGEEDTNPGDFWEQVAP